MRWLKNPIIFLIILASFIRLWFFFKSDNFEGIVTMEKVGSALKIISNPDLRANFDGHTSMLYNYLLAACLRFWPDILVTPRVLSMFFGILIIIPFYLLVKLMFSQTTAFYSGFILALFPLHAIQSTFSMSDAASYCVFFSCLYFIYKFKVEGKKVIWLILAIVLFNIAALLRFESWAFIPILSALLSKESKRHAVLFFCFALIAPCVWMSLCYYFKGDIFLSFNIAARTVQTEILMNRVTHSKSILGWLNVLYKMLGQAIVISGLIGIIYAFIKKRGFYLAVFFLCLYLLYTVNTLAGKMRYNERYAILLGLLIIPYSVFCFEKAAIFLRRMFNIPKFAVILFLFLPYVLFSAGVFKKNTLRYIQDHTLPFAIKEIAGWMKENIPASDKVIIGADKYDLYCQDIIVRSGIPLKNLLQVTYFNPYPTLTQADIREYITKEKPAYFVLNSKGFLEEILKFDIDSAEIKDFGCTFKLVYSKDMFHMGRFNIYKIYFGDSHESK